MRIARVVVLAAALFGCWYEPARAYRAKSGYSQAIRITSRNFFDAAATKNGRALQLAIDPQSGKAIRTGIDDDDDDD